MAEEYTGSGGLLFKGCGSYRQTYYYYSYFGEGDVAYIKERARYGILEKVVIKKVIFTKDEGTYNQLVVKYKDTFNALHSNLELVDELTALEMIQFYYLYLDALGKTTRC